MMETLNKNGMKLYEIAGVIAHENPKNFIMEWTNTSFKRLNLMELTEKILSDPKNIDWVKNEGYLNNTISLNRFKRMLLESIDDYNDAIRKLNVIADAHPVFILLNQKETKLKEDSIK